MPGDFGPAAPEGARRRMSEAEALAEVAAIAARSSVSNRPSRSVMTAGIALAALLGALLLLAVIVSVGPDPSAGSGI